MNNFKNFVMTSPLMYLIIAGVPSIAIFYYFLPVFTVVTTVISLGGVALYFATTKWGRVYVTHYAGKEDIMSIRESGFNRGMSETIAKERGYDISTWGQAGKDQVSFVSVNHKAIVDMRTYNSKDIVALHMWVKPEDIFLSDAIVVNFLGLSTKYGRIIEVTADREFVNKQIAEGRVDTEENKAYAWFSKIVTAYIVMSYNSRCTFKLLKDKLSSDFKKNQPIVL